MRRDEFFAEWSALHGGAKIEGIVRGWLTISFHLAKSLQAIRISPNTLTSTGVLLALALYFVVDRSDISEPFYLLLALVLLALSLAADGVDGSLAIIARKSSHFGAAWDAIADRISESLWALVFIALGADFRIVLSAWLIASIQEYVRARSAGLGLKEIGIVTICERPVRASILAVAIVAQLLLVLSKEDFEIPSAPISNTFASLWLVMQLISLTMLWRRTTASLKSSN
ncbi:MAG: hypothetical protein RL287_321 [Actinomycetota bacterium]